MTLRTQVLVWVGVRRRCHRARVAVRPILLPFVVGIALAYLLNPLVNHRPAHPDRARLVDGRSRC